MKTWRSALLGVMGLAALQAAIGSSQGPGRVGGLLADLGRLSSKFLDPTVPAFAGKVTKTKPKPNATTSSSTPASSSTSSSPTSSSTTTPAEDRARLEQLKAGATPGSPASARIGQQLADTPATTPSTKPRTGLSATRIASET